jgi:hypothetical protein
MQRAFIAAIITSACIVAPAAHAATAELDCTLRFSLTGWSAILEHAEGRGVVTCADGRTMHVSIESRGGGLTVGKSHIDNGTGKFSDVHRISDVLGTYAEGGAHAGVVKSSTAQVLTKGNVSLALAGTGEGVDLGVSVGQFKLTRIK